MNGCKSLIIRFLYIMGTSIGGCETPISCQERDVPMTIPRELTHVAATVKGKLTRVFAPHELETLAHQSRFLQRSTSKLTGQDFVALMTTDMVDNATMSLDGLCDLLRQHNPPAVMTPQALHQRLLSPPAVTYLHDVLQLALRENLEAVRVQLPAALWPHLAGSFSKIARSVACMRNSPRTLKGLEEVGAPPR